MRGEIDAEVLARIEGATVRFQGREVLSGVSAAVRRGEIVTVIGPNGAGKTTLLRVVLGLLVPDAGEVQRRPGLRIGYMPQRIAVDASLPLTVRRFLGLCGREGRGRIEAALAEVGAARVAQTPLQSISGGEMQRVLLARALLRDPDLLVLDEPVQGVDVQGQADLFELITGLRDRRGCGVLMVSHDLHLVMAATDRVLCLNHNVCCTGSPAAVTRDPAYLTLFGVAAPQGLALYAHAHGPERRRAGEAGTSGAAKVDNG